MSDSRTTIQKQSFNQSLAREDGLLLQIHHTVPCPGSGNRRIRFTHSQFHPFLDQLCACDHEGNVFIINFCINKYWVLPTKAACTAIEFVPLKANLLLVAVGQGSLVFLHVETGRKMGHLIGHNNPVKQISFSTECYCLTASEKEAIVWDLKSNSQVHRMSLDSSSTVKYVAFIPVTNHILSCFQNDTMTVWKYKTFEPMKQILPATWKSRHLQSIAFTRNGRAMILGGRSQSLVVFAVDKWVLERVITLPDTVRGVKQIQFLPQLFDGGANKILAMLSSHHTFHLYDIDSNTFLRKTLEPEGGIVKFSCSFDGKYIACILATGELNIYTAVKLFDSSGYQQVKAPETNAVVRPKPIKRLTTIQKEVRQLLDKSRLSPILKRYGEYPENYRALIWKTLLKTPRNEQAFIALANRGCHPAFDNLDKMYPLENKLMLKNLQRILSILSNWCPLFSQIKSLPLFVFPFVQIFQNDPLASFEIICTVVVNWCQHWFQYFPFPPINIMAIIENIMSECDPALLNHFNNVGITSQMYAWALLETAFSEVFAKSEWLQFWDHVLSNEAAFLILAIAAYNITSRATLLSCNTLQEFDYFYHNQNVINMKRFIAKCYDLSETISPTLHPMQYLVEVKPLQSGSYPIFTNYPKEIVDYQAEQLLKCKEEEEKIASEERQAVENRLSQLTKMKEQIRQDENDARLRDLETVYKKSLQDEQDKIISRRKKMNELNQEVHDREIQIMETAKMRLLRVNTEERCAALARSLDELQRSRAIEDSNEESIQNNIMRHKEQLLIQKQHLEKILNITCKDTVSLPMEHTTLKRHQQTLAQELNRIRNENMSQDHLRNLNLATRIATVDNMLHQVEVELAKEMAERQHNLITNHSHLKTIELECVTKQLEHDVSSLLEKLAAVRICETNTRAKELADSLIDRQKMNTEHSVVIQEFKDFFQADPILESNTSSSVQLWQDHDYGNVKGCAARPPSTKSSNSTGGRQPEMYHDIAGPSKRNRRH